MPKKLKLKKYRSFLKYSSTSETRGSFRKKLESRRLFALLYGNISNTQYQKFFQKAEKFPGKIGIQFLSLVENRLDIVVTKMFFFSSFQNARQFISHGGILLNHKNVNISSTLVKPGDIIQIKNPEEFFQKFWAKQGSIHLKLENLVQKNRIKHPHLEVNYNTFTGIFLFSPYQIYYSIPKLKCTEAGISLNS